MAENLRVSDGATPEPTADGGAASEPEHRELERNPEHDATLHDDPEREAVATPGESSQPGPVIVFAAGTATTSTSPAVADPGRTMLAEIQALKEEQKKVRDARKEVAKKLRNAEKRRRRLKARANRLSDADLLAVISLRSHEKAHGNCGTAEEDEDDDSDSEQEAEVAGGTGSTSSSGPKAAPTPKKKIRGR
jgi:hypothetical protein